MLGKTTPRIVTPPLVTGRPGPCGCGCALTTDTSLGFEAARFIETMCGVNPLPWQRWWLIHALELRSDGGFRYRTVVTLVARQSGKTALIKFLALFLMYTGRSQLVLGVAQSLEYAREAWSGACDLASDDPDLAREIANITRVNGNQSFQLRSGARYKIAAANRSAGRGLSVDTLILDELREHRDWEAWGALTKTTNARPNALILGISNAGDDQSVVLNSLRASAMAGTDPTLGIFEWSAPGGCELDDLEAWAQANPALGHTVSEQAIRSALTTDPPTVFRTEVLCQRVEALDAAIDSASWAMSADPAGSMDKFRDRQALCLDVSPDGMHVTLVAAVVLDDDRCRVEVVEAWNSVATARSELPTLLATEPHRVFGWFPSGPGAALGADLRKLDAVEIKGSEVTEACMELANLIESTRILHPNDPLLDAHIIGASKLRSGEGFRFTRSGASHVDAAYALAGAVRLARTIPIPVKKAKARVW